MSSDYIAPVTRPRVSLDDVAHIHPPKVEFFDVPAMSNTDPKGFRRVVDEYRLEDFGLYMARAIDRHSQLTYVESWLLPELGLRVSRWRRKPGAPPREDTYIDLVDIDPGHGERSGRHSGDRGGAAGPVWRVVDIYLDIHVWTGSRIEVVDSDELLAALDARLIDAETAQRAMERTYRTVEGITRYGYDTGAWLKEHGVELQWLER